MSQYIENSLIWSPPENELLFLVKVPIGRTLQKKSEYLQLMELRLEWMLLKDQSEETKIQLIQTLDQLNPARDTPLFNQPQWQREWATALIHEMPEFYDRVEIHYSIFPVEPIGEEHPDYPRLLELHQEETLALWLYRLTNP